MTKVYQASYQYLYEKIRTADRDLCLGIMVQYEAQIAIAEAEKEFIPLNKEVTWKFGSATFKGKGPKGMDVAITGFRAGIDACRYRLMEIDGQTWRRGRSA